VESAAEEPPLKLVSFFIQVEKGRRRPGRSGMSVSCLNLWGDDVKMWEEANSTRNLTRTNVEKGKRGRDLLLSVPCGCAGSVVVIVWNSG